MQAIASLSIVCTATMLWFASPALAVEVTPAPGPAARLSKPSWVGFAVSPTGRVFTQPSAEEDRARVFARRECEGATETKCSAIAVPKSWKVAAAQCGRTAFIAGVPFGSALPLARQKALAAGVRIPCRQVFPR